MPKVCLQGVKAGQKRYQGTTKTVKKDVPVWLTDTYKNRQNRRIRTQGTTRLQITSGETRKSKYFSILIPFAEISLLLHPYLIIERLLTVFPPALVGDFPVLRHYQPVAFQI